ncbi:integrase [Peptococcaceae bacterium SCADC1_2_3]|jgi:transposase|nr:integrase [Peptococcaceae bacterium SCADC1_2_3]KFI34688.1 integrase [Peptococcaceae bacterium SCADC1_2_3]KFI35749.1 integrase [Peptococcaceae bacterium SCADC1_2_3]KFI37797.1 integrase [Peptococcaceae bacterium SCADC1_2_3]
MRKIKEVLRLHWELGMTQRQIARSCNLSRSTVSDYLARAKIARLSWPLPENLDETSIETLLFPEKATPNKKMQEIDFAWVHQELRKKGVTLQLLWSEYKVEQPQGYQYSRFCDIYRRWCKTLDASLHQVHRAGEKMFVDYAGQTVPIVNPKTGEPRSAYIFVAVLGASNYTYAEATLNQHLAFWIDAHCRTLEFFGGVPQIVVPDNTKTGITHPCRYEPDLNPTYQEMATHYDTVIIPTRPSKPKDKAKVETAVQLVERWILAPLRNRTFFSLGELNQAISEILKDLNQRPFQKLEGSRKELYETLDKPALKPLPAERYEFAQWKKAKVNIDYHIEVDHNYYSVPYQLIHKTVDIRITTNTVEILFKGQRVSVHTRSYHKGEYSTFHQHRPLKHQKYLEWTPERLVNWSESVGPHTVQMVEKILESKLHPEQGYRSCLGLFRLGQRYSNNRLEAACKRALALGAISYKSVKSILTKGLDQLPAEEIPPFSLTVQHSNIRGAEYYQAKEGPIC